MGEGSKGQVVGSELLGLGSERKSEGRPYLAGGKISKKKLWITWIDSRVPMHKRIGEFGASVHQSGGYICFGG